VKSFNKTVVAFFLLGIYCLSAISAFATTPATTNDDSKHFIEVFQPGKLPHHSPSSYKVAIKRASAHQVSFQDRHTSGFIQESFHTFLKNELQQQKYFSYNLIINHRKSDTLFPFHYFW
jgi:hypothetical protein